MSLNSTVGTRYAQAPELFLPLDNTRGKYNYKADVWSLGVLVYSLCTQELPFYDTDPEKLKEKIIYGDYNTEIDISHDFK